MTESLHRLHQGRKNERSLKQPYLGLLIPRVEVEVLIRVVPVPVFAPVSSKRTATILWDILRAEGKRPPSDQLKTATL